MRKVLVRVDASRRIGGGHVMRCLTLADELAGHGCAVTFVCAQISEVLARRVERSGHRLVRIEPEDELLLETAQWDSAILSDEAQLRDSARTAAAAGTVDWIVCDHYRLDRRWLDQAGPGAKRLVLDDLANRPMACDILVDQTLGRSREDYAPWVSADCTLLAGAQFALLRPEFAASRSAALKRRHKAGKVERVLVSLGATDIDGVTRDAVVSLLEAGVDCSIDVVLSSGAPSLESVLTLAEREPRVTVHVDSQNMAGLMASADLAVGAPGTSSWERCCLGLPAVTLQLADNQSLVSRSLAEAGATVAVGRAEELGAAVKRLTTDGEVRARMVAAAASIVDGEGARRVADAMLGTERADSAIRLRLAEPDDSETLWLWRNDPLMRAMAKTQEPIPWPEHATWFERLQAGGNTRIYIAEAGADQAAMVRFDRVEEGALVSINVNPALRGRSIGKAVLASACQQYSERYPVAGFVAEVKIDNAASRRIFEAAGFHSLGVSEAGYLRYARPPERCP